MEEDEQVVCFDKRRMKSENTEGELQRATAISLQNEPIVTRK
jgi:hypothetical protein